MQAIPLINSLNLQIASLLVLLDRSLAERFFSEDNDSSVKFNNYLQTANDYKHDDAHCQLITVIHSYEKNKVVQNTSQRYYRRVIHASIEIEVLCKNKNLNNFLIKTKMLR